MDEEVNKISNIIQSNDLSHTETTSKSIEAIVSSIVKQKCDTLDSIITAIRGMLKDDDQPITDREIEDILIQLPSVLYELMEGQEIVGIQLDLATQIYKEAQSEAYRLARGTINERNAVADIKTRREQLERIIYDRAYKIIKGKLEMAVETLNAVKKVQASRQERYNGMKQDLRYRL